MKEHWRLFALKCALFIGTFSMMGQELPKTPLDQTSLPVDSSCLLSEEPDDWHVLIEEMAENGFECDQWEERLSELATNPVPLNEANREMLESIPMLSAEQVENLSYYLYRYGPMKSLSELLLVEGMDAQTMRWLKPFVRLGALPPSPIESPSMKKALAYGKNEFRWAMGSTLQTKAGYRKSGSDRYAGSPLHAGFRYGFNYKDLLEWGIVLEKDPGERWWDGKKNGVDFVSMHLMAKDAKHQNAALLGDFTLRFGQGLVCGNAFSLGKNTAGITPEQTGSNISRHFSTSEYRFFRGAAMRITLKPYRIEQPKQVGLELTTFVSTRKLDSNDENGTVESITETGLHRTVSEIENMNRLKQFVVGSHLGLRAANFALGCTALSWMLDHSSSHTTWQALLARGNMGGNLSIDARMSWNGIQFFGESALDVQAHLAGVAGMSFKPYPRMSLCFLGRKYSPWYRAPFSNGFSEGTTTSDEEGVYASMDVQLAKRWHMNGYLDLFRFPWIRYGVNTPSWGRDVAVELSSTIGRNGVVKCQVKNKIKELHDAEFDFPTHPTRMGSKWQMRFQVLQKIGIWSMKTTLITNHYQFGTKRTKGGALAQDLEVQPLGDHFALTLHTVLFNTDAWENRIYLWEKDLPGSFSMPMLYGEGVRNSLYAKYEIRNIRIQVKISDSFQPGVSTLGEGPETIQGQRRTEVRLMLGWKF